MVTKAFDSLHCLILAQGLRRSFKQKTKQPLILIFTPPSHHSDGPKKKKSLCRIMPWAVSEISRTSVKPWLQHLAQALYLGFLSINFIICKMGIITASISKNCDALRQYIWRSQPKILCTVGTQQPFLFIIVYQILLFFLPPSHTYTRREER